MTVGQRICFRDVTDRDVVAMQHRLAACQAEAVERQDWFWVGFGASYSGLKLRPDDRDSEPPQRCPPFAAGWVET
jgi:hypothetical protein